MQIDAVSVVDFVVTAQRIRRANYASKPLTLTEEQVAARDADVMSFGCRKLVRGRLQHRCHDAESIPDARQAAMVAILEAWPHYDPARDVPFHAFAKIAADRAILAEVVRQDAGDAGPWGSCTSLDDDCDEGDNPLTDGADSTVTGHDVIRSRDFYGNLTPTTEERLLFSDNQGGCQRESGWGDAGLSRRLGVVRP